MQYLILLIWSLLAPPSANESQPNLIIIFTDDLGYGDLGCYGHPTIRTPHLDRMADEGMLFTQFYVPASVCTPSRAGLLTGRYPVRTGMVRGKIPGRVLFPNSQTGLPLSEITIAEVLKDAGYATSMVGKWHLGHLPEYLPVEQGFDEYYGIPYSNDMDHVGAQNGEAAYWNVPIMGGTEIVERPAEQRTLTRRYTERAINFIEKNTGRPFFLYLAHTMPHIPLFVSEQFEGNSERGLYGDVVEEIDWSVGQILETLRKNELEENTLVIFTSDNGPWLVMRENGGSAGLLKDGKGTTWEGGMRVPMIAWWPGKVKQGQRVSALATTLDLLPMAASMAGTNSPEGIDGVDMLPLLTGEKDAVRDFFVYYRNDEIYAARLGEWKAHYITQTEYPAGPKNYHDPPLLYHLGKDPSEKYDVAEMHPGIIDRINALVLEHAKTVEDEFAPSIEGESLLNTASVSGGKLRIQNMDAFKGNWSGDEQLWWVEAHPGDRLEFEIVREAGGVHEFFGFFTRAGDYGIIRISVNGIPVGAYVDGYNEGVEPTGPVSFGSVDFKKGKNIVSVEVVGKDYRAAGFSNGYLVGIDGFLIK